MTSLMSRLRGRVSVLAVTTVAAFALGAGAGAGAVQAFKINGHVLVPQNCWTHDEYMCLDSHPFGDRHAAAPGVHDNDSECVTDPFGNVRCPLSSGGRGEVTQWPPTGVGGSGTVGSPVPESSGVGGSGLGSADKYCMNEVGVPTCGVGQGGHVGTPVPDSSGVGGSGFGSVEVSAP